MEGDSLTSFEMYEKLASFYSFETRQIGQNTLYCLLSRSSTFNPELVPAKNPTPPSPSFLEEDESTPMKNRSDSMVELSGLELSKPVHLELSRPGTPRLVQENLLRPIQDDDIQPALHLMTSSQGMTWLFCPPFLTFSGLQRSFSETDLQSTDLLTIQTATNGREHLGKYNAKRLWSKKKRTPDEQEIKQNIKFRGKDRFQLRLSSSMRSVFLWEYEKKSIKPLRVYFLIILWSIAILGPAQDLSTITDNTTSLLPYLVVRYGVMVPMLVVLLGPALVPAWFMSIVPWIQVMWGTFMIVLGMCELGLTSGAASVMGREYFPSRFVQIVIWGFTLLRLNFTWMIACNCILLAALNIATIVSVSAGKAFFSDMWEALFLSILAMVMSTKASYSLEKHAKQDFLLKRLVEVERKR